MNRLSNEDRCRVLACLVEGNMEKNQAAVALGKLGGSVTSRRKAAAARRNAKLGGWPKGRKRGKRQSKDANVRISK